ncbi:glutamyl-tRNA reductase [Pasteurella atlantica]|uniref:glutamyl-tRNA reductase n=1 Tax=Pasteurellaceae TaxID=712 RepID=UPI00275CC5EC|nr:glutamyl-tRNA reductase [Pasteurella atlantica]MDP8034534.1 glutamyl-tRNA reductase [Pasteurella atlantica]MDP8036460.1 glutamyl-tRNA reductase [Pasteurella atlantica]MDP8038419.1 glutamyl-tRNA reductase [Pasteurella atlantica]MDP8048770.1 glutamyl-tRNA reductase [Pasteurella atlantica]MDP8050727.1 glutamyl-tRNA reductase [Pasteurella atlantica]
MTILVVGINHKTASVKLREKIAFVDEHLAVALTQISQQKLAESAVILSTCNRTEIYFHHSQIPPQSDNPVNIQWCNHCVTWLSKFHHFDLVELQQSIYFKQNFDAAEHLMSVACGLDSLVLGEPQILGQVKKAYQQSEQFYLTQKMTFSIKLSRLFQKTFSTAKRVRSETDIGGSAVSVAYAACGLARQIFDDFSKIHFLMVGAGETIELVCRYLVQHNAKNLMVANRTKARAEQLQEKIGEMEILSLDQLQIGLNKADIVISSTGASEPLISKEMITQAQQSRYFAPLLLIDIAVPCDIEEGVDKLEGVYAYNVDDLEAIINQNLAQRQLAAEQAKNIVYQECRAFFEWLKQLQSRDLIKFYRQSAEHIRLQLLEKAQYSLSQGEDPQKVLTELSYKLTNQLLHCPTATLQDMAKSDNVKGLQCFSRNLRLDKPCK